MQMEMGQLDVHDVPGLGVQLLTPRRVQRPFGLFHQRVVALVVPASQALRIVALGMQVARKKAIRVETVAIALNQAVKSPFFWASSSGTASRGLTFTLKPTLFHISWTTWALSRL